MGGNGYVGHNGRKRLVSEINVTPLVDVMLVLLIIFMVTFRRLSLRSQSAARLRKMSSASTSATNGLTDKSAGGANALGNTQGFRARQTGE